MAELLPLGHVLREQLRREQPLDHVVVPDGALAACEPDHTGDGVCLEDRAHSVFRQPEPVLRPAALALEVGRAERPVGPDALEHPLRHRGVVRQRRGVEPRSLAACVDAIPGELARRDERERLVGRLEDLAAAIERVAPGRLVAGDTRVQHQVVVPARNGDRVELDRAEPADHLQHRVGPALDGPRRREGVPRDEIAAGRLGGDLDRRFGQDSCASPSATHARSSSDWTNGAPSAAARSSTSSVDAPACRPA